jgi:CII-binding regulator of phage lambda lysogenization HflD
VFEHSNSIFSIQRLRDVNSHNESITRSTLQEQKLLKQKHDQELTDEKLRASTAISQVRKQAAATTTKYESALKQQNELVQGYHQLSEEVAEEFVSLLKTYEVKVLALEATAQKRLDSNKNLKEKISALKDELEETHKDMHSQLDEARQDICVLQEQLIERSRSVKSSSL